MTTVLNQVSSADIDGSLAVETYGLTRRFGGRTAVNDVDLLVPRGCAFGYLGPMGPARPR